MAKPTARRIPSDDCIVTVDGVAYNTHEGEWVELRPGGSVAGLQVAASLAGIETELKSFQGEADGEIQAIVALGRHLGRMAEVIAPRLMAWTWTNDRSEPHPQPDGTADQLTRLLGDTELLYLFKLVYAGESPAQRKNDLRPLPITSSATGSAETGTPSHTKGRNRSKAS